MDEHQDLYYNALTKFDTLEDSVRYKILEHISRLLINDAAIYTPKEFRMLCRKADIKNVEMAAAVEYCWLNGWCCYEPTSGMICGGNMIAHREDGDAQDRRHYLIISGKELS